MKSSTSLFSTSDFIIRGISKKNLTSSNCTYPYILSFFTALVALKRTNCLAVVVFKSLVQNFLLIPLLQSTCYYLWDGCFQKYFGALMPILMQNNLSVEEVMFCIYMEHTRFVLLHVFFRCIWLWPSLKKESKLWPFMEEGTMKVTLYVDHPNRYPVVYFLGCPN